MRLWAFMHTFDYWHIYALVLESIAKSPLDFSELNQASEPLQDQSLAASNIKLQ